MVNSEGSIPLSTSSLLRLKSNKAKPSVSSSHTSIDEDSVFICGTSLTTNKTSRNVAQSVATVELSILI